MRLIMFLRLLVKLHQGFLDTNMSLIAKDARF